MTPVPAIRFLDAAKSYGTKPALASLNMSIGQGEFFGLLGHNGAGKTTAIGLLCGLIRPTSGDVEVLGRSAVKDPSTVKRLIGVVPQELVADSFFSLSRMLLIQSKLSGVQPDPQWCSFLLERLGLAAHASKTSRQLSGGMKRRMMIARALVHKPKILLLDEPTAGVDVELRHRMWEFIAELHGLGVTVVLTTHYLEEAEQFCERICVLKAGKVVALEARETLLAKGGSPLLVATLAPAQGVQAPTLHALAQELTAGTATWTEHPRGGPQDTVLLLTPYTTSSAQSLGDALGTLTAIANKLPATLTAVETRRPSLEDVFLRLSS